MKIKDGWFEENEDGTRDYIAILEDDSAVRLKNAYLKSVDFGGLQWQDGNEPVVITLTQTYHDRPAIADSNV